MEARATQIDHKALIAGVTPGTAQKVMRDVNYVSAETFVRKAKLAPEAAIALRAELLARQWLKPGKDEHYKRMSLIFPRDFDRTGRVMICNCAGFGQAPVITLPWNPGQ